MRPASLASHSSPSSPNSFEIGTTSGGADRKRGWPSTTSVSFEYACRLSRSASFSAVRRCRFATAALVRDLIEASSVSISSRAYQTCRFDIAANSAIAWR